jgi:nucleotide-binding universal stress UspA family protein
MTSLGGTIGPAARVAPSAGRIQTVMLATDLSAASATATDHAIELACRLQTRLVIVNVIGERRILGGPGQHWRVDQIRALREEAVLRLTAASKRAGARTDFLIWDGDIGPSIVAAAEAEGADLVVVGSRGLDRAGRFLLGSISDYVLRHAACPVLVVRPAAIQSVRPA